MQIGQNCGNLTLPRKFITVSMEATVCIDYDKKRGFGEMIVLSQLVVEYVHIYREREIERDYIRGLLITGTVWY